MLWTHIDDDGPSIQRAMNDDLVRLGDVLRNGMLP